MAKRTPCYAKHDEKRSPNGHGLGALADEKSELGQIIRMGLLGRNVAVGPSHAQRKDGGVVAFLRSQIPRRTNCWGEYINYRRKGQKTRSPVVA